MHKKVHFMVSIALCCDEQPLFTESPVRANTDDAHLGMTLGNSSMVSKVPNQVLTF